MGDTMADGGNYLRIGDTVPDFTATTSQGELTFHEYLGDSWGVLFSHPADFTPVCTTELGTAAKLSEEWAKRNVKVMALSVDSAENHTEWIKDIEESQGCKVDYPIVADTDRTVANLYGMIAPDA